MTASQVTILTVTSTVKALVAGLKKARHFRVNFITKVTLLLEFELLKLKAGTGVVLFTTNLQLANKVSGPVNRQTVFGYR